MIRDSLIEIEMKNCMCLFLVFLTVLYGCAEDKSLSDGVDQQSEEPFFKFVTYSASSKTTGDDLNVWEEGDDIRMSYIQNNETASTVPDDRIYYYYTVDAGTSVLLESTRPITTSFVEDGADTIDIFAFSANSLNLFDSISNNNFYQLDLSESSKAGVLANPLAAIRADVVASQVDSLLPMVFKHLLSFINLNITDNTSNGLPSDMQIYMTEIRTKVQYTWDLTGTHPDIVSTIQPSNYDQGQDTIWFVKGLEVENGYDDKYVAEMVPQKFTNGRFVIHFADADGNDLFQAYEHPSNSGFEFLSGYSYNLNATFNAGDVEFTVGASDFIDDTDIGGYEWDGTDSVLVFYP